MTVTFLTAGKAELRSKMNLMSKADADCPQVATVINLSGLTAYHAERVLILMRGDDCSHCRMARGAA